MPNIEDALALAIERHHGQKDPSGDDYIMHVVRVVARLQGELERMAAALHDCLEDTDLTAEELEQLGYPPEVIEAVVCVTKLPKEEDNYEAFIERVAGGSLIARRVKLADLRDNTDPRRTPHPTERDVARTAKYLRAIKRIEATLTPEEMVD